MSTNPAPYMYYSYDGMRCRLWKDALGITHAECWDDEAHLYEGTSVAAIMRDGVIMSPDELALSLRRFPSAVEG